MFCLRVTYETSSLFAGVFAIMVNFEMTKLCEKSTNSNRSTVVEITPMDVSAYPLITSATIPRYETVVLPFNLLTSTLEMKF